MSTRLASSLASRLASRTARLRPAGADEGRRGDGGFTVAEQVVTIGVLSIVLVIVFGFMINATNITTRADADVRAEQDAINALRTVTEDLRSARQVMPCDATTPYNQCVKIEISKVTSGNGTCPKRVVVYRVVGTDLTQDLTDYADNCTTVTQSGTRTLIEDVESPTIFTYFAADGITPLNLAVSADVALVAVTPAIEVALSIKYHESAGPLTLTSIASLRNNRVELSTP